MGAQIKLRGMMQPVSVFQHFHRPDHPRWWELLSQLKTKPFDKKKTKKKTAFMEDSMGNLQADAEFD